MNVRSEESRSRSGNHASAVHDERSVVALGRISPGLYGLYRLFGGSRTVSELPCEVAWALSALPFRSPGYLRSSALSGLGV